MMLQVQDHLEGPVGMALYEWQNGQLGHACVHGGESVSHSLLAFPDLCPSSSCVWHMRQYAA